MADYGIRGRMTEIQLMQKTTFWEDIEIGRIFETGSVTLDVKAIRVFAENFDPQPYHLDPEAGKNSLFGGLCASGWHVTAIMMKLVSDQLAEEQIPLVGSGKVSWLEWYRPVFGGDSISAHVAIKDKSRPATETDHGLIECDIAIHNQEEIKVAALSTFLMIESRKAHR
jgi:acyl dehydratase